MTVDPWGLSGHLSYSQHVRHARSARSCGGHPSRPEETIDRPEGVTKQELQNLPAEQSGGMQRGQAFAVFPGGASTGWAPPRRRLRHLRLHHQRNDDGRVRPWDTELLRDGECDFIYIPARLIPERWSQQKEERCCRPSRRRRCHRGGRLCAHTATRWTVRLRGISLDFLRARDRTAVRHLRESELTCDNAWMVLARRLRFRLGDGTGTERRVGRTSSSAGTG